uniref:Uncharacterized protein n=1 Tax=Arundo donax TaxID=35708 RepID=A0A0A8Z7S1_ARUDO
MWMEISRIIGRQIGDDYVSIAQCWLSNKRFEVVNMISASALWSLWKLRNSFCFQNCSWTSMGLIWGKIIPMLKNWQVLCHTCSLDAFSRTVSKLVELSRMVERLTA